MKNDNIEQQLNIIINDKMIYPVYQPIISLQNAKILGYEILSRISLDSCTFTVEEMFSYANKYNCLWELDYICRKKGLKNIKDTIGNKKLFINVDPYIFNDPRFKGGMTLSYLKRYNISPDNIVFEICERTNIEELDSFKKTVNHYKSQHYQIAVDDFGKNYSNFNRVFFLHPLYVKLDISLISNINNDSVKQSLVKGLVDFCHKENILLIAEGVETIDELSSLINLGVDYAQGYYISKPYKEPKKIKDSIVSFIISENENKIEINNKPSFIGKIGDICKKLCTTSYNTKITDVYEFMKKHKEVSEICVIDNNKKVLGLLTRQFLDERLGGRYGYSLYSKDTVSDHLDRYYLEVDYRIPIVMVSRIALIRPNYALYDAIVVSDNGNYVGIVTVKDLLEASISIQIENAMDTSPLTYLPGNTQIESRISELLKSDGKYSVLYIDIDNFKAYNDAYGFEYGDVMIKSVATIIETSCNNGEFIGHIGGDDFVIISNEYNLESVFNQIIDLFHNCLPELYTEEDYKQNCIHSHNRQGLPEIFPLASLSGALITNEKIKIKNMGDFSYKIALTKKESKKHIGDYLQKTEDIIFETKKGLV